MQINKEIIKQVHEWDSKQKLVIECDEESFSLVEAGPGSGKTAVACARIALLVEERGLDPSNILLVSFTRAAVKELQERIEGYATEPINIAGLKIVTLDSFTWQILRGYSDDNTTRLLQSYENNIQAFVELLINSEPDIIEYLEELEHVVIDEAQDLVGSRADLVLQLIDKLPGECGVTVFTDSAQAIYGFTDDQDNDGEDQLTLAERIVDDYSDLFVRGSLDNIHRTSDPKLQKLFKDGRKRLVGMRESSVEGWLEMKELIQSCAHGEVPSADEQDLQERRDVLILYRTRAEVLTASSFLWDKGTQHKCRMSGIPSRIHPWISRALGRFTDRYINFEEFSDAWKMRCSNSGNIHTIDVTDAWELLRNNAGYSTNQVDIMRLRSILSRERPPIDFLVDERDLEGPIVGTIHASKGRESDNVHLMLPVNNSIRKETDLRKFAEEQRVLFVGASRARNKLLTGIGYQSFSRKLEPSNRTYRPLYGKPCVQMEIGRSGDIDIQSVTSKNCVSSDQADELQNWLWENQTNSIELASEYSTNKKMNILYETERESFVAALSKNFSNDLWNLADIYAGWHAHGKYKPNSTIRHIRMVGSRTAVVPEGQRDLLYSPYRESGLVLVPVISAFSVISFRRWGRY